MHGILTLVLLFYGQAHGLQGTSRHRLESQTPPQTDFHSLTELRRFKRVALVSKFGGELGLFGLGLELNVVESLSVNTSFGGGPNYQSFSLSIKRILGDESLSPYLLGGFTRWYSSARGRSFEKTTPGFLGEKFLSERERNSGHFNRNLLFPGIGLQYVQLRDDWSGFSVFAELSVLVDIGEFVAAPTGALGASYYF